MLIFILLLYTDAFDGNMAQMSKKPSKLRHRTKRGAIKPGQKSFTPRPKNSAGILRSQTGLLTILIVLVCLAVSAAHWPALSANALFFDDDLYLTDNKLVQNPGWDSAKRFLTEVLEPSTVHGYYQPLTMISLMLDHALGGRPDYLLPFHRTSLILHVANTALIIVLLYLLFGQIWIAAAIALLFGLHPMTVEAIPWVGERKTLLSAFFALWSLISYVLYARRNRSGFLIGAGALYVLAIMAKPISLPLPALMLLIDYWPLKRLTRKTIIEKSPLFVIAAIFAVITIISQGRTAAITTPQEHGPVNILLTLCHNIIFYPFKMIYPVSLSSYYVFPDPLDFSNTMVLAGTIGTCLLIPLLLYSLRRTRALFTGWLFFFIAIFPTMGVVGFTIVIAADKFAYLPSVGFLMILTSLLTSFCAAGKYTARRIIVTVLILALACAEAFTTRQNLSHWRDTAGLYKRMLTFTPDAVPMLYNLANALDKQKNADQAITYYKRILALDPDYYRAHNNLGVDLKNRGKSDQAVKLFRRALQINPNFAEAHYNLANELQDQRKLDEAVTNYQRALQLKPEYQQAHYNLGNALKAQHKFEKAIEHYRKSLQLKPDDPIVLTNLANALSEQGKPQQAIAALKQAVSIDPDYAIAYSNLGWEFKNAGNDDQAIKNLRRAVQLNPNLIPPLVGLTTILNSRPDSNTDEAISFAETAARITKRRNPMILELLADSYAKAGRFELAKKTAQQALNIALAAKNRPLAERLLKKIKSYL